MTEENTELDKIDITIKTDEGPIEITLHADLVPKTCANFLNLAKQGFYENLVFHRVVDDFMVQGGDPTGSGRGGPGYEFDDEFHSDLRHDRAGTLSMANSGPDTNGSQFFITHKPTPHLDDKHSVFGEVTEGQDVVDHISERNRILEINIRDDPESLFEEMEEQIKEWNKALESRH